MAQSAKKILGFRLTPEKIEYIENTLTNIMQQKKLEKPDSLYYIIKTYNDTMKEKVSVDYSHVKPWECNFLNFSNETWECLEPMGTSKKPIPLGDSDIDVKIKCKACFEGHQIAENERLKRLLERGNIVKLTDFYKEFLALTKHGFSVGCIMCKGDLLDKNRVIVSRDGEVIYCPLQNMDIVNIKEICEEVIDTANKTKGCQYLIQFTHHVAYKGSTAEERIKEILPQLDKITDEKEEI